ncbi:Hypothetical protein R9X50_00260600 [Acrodontium crateriforme]|uniref:Aromatic-L-amino-acid decarboxylase n=1 Tax=Acrodontium crateriforme TaxID=150365 RepID=A0AAQ3RB47_9PEZI|nr:Hypothetical protein R9X50_00260600 [Acrodontium crateriforme]
MNGTQLLLFLFPTFFKNHNETKKKKNVASLQKTGNGAKTQPNGTLDHRTVPPMGLTGRQFIDAATASIDEIEAYYSTVASRPLLPDISPGYLRDLLPGQAPAKGEPWPEIQRDIERVVMPGMTHWQHPKFMAFFPASSSYPAILGELWSAALTVPAFNWICSPAVTELETVVLDWLAQILGLPASFLSKGEGGGVIQGSASEAIVTCMVAARERYIKRQLGRQGITEPEEFEDKAYELRSKLVALGSDHTHSSTKKGAIIAGTRFRSVEALRSDAFALKGENLRAKIEELTAQGLHPYYLTVCLGTTNTAAVDDFASIAEVAKDYPDIWIHCDAAYAGSALVLPEYHHISQQMAMVDSFDMSMHKWLLVNFDCSCLFIQKRRDLTDALTITPAYLRNQYTDSGLVTDYRDWQIPMGRRFRALKIWFVLRTWGVEGLQRHIEHSMNIGSLFANLMCSRLDLFEITTPPAFALTVFTVKPLPKRTRALSDDDGTNGADPRRPWPDAPVPSPLQADEGLRHAANQLTEEVYTLIEQRKEFFLTSTVLGDVYAIRVVSGNAFADEHHIRQAFATIVSTTEEVLAKHRDA